VYLTAALLLTLPVWADPSNTTIGFYGDPDKFMGFLAWFPFAVTHGHNPLHMTWIDLPSGINAMWDTTMPVGSLLIWPVRAVFGIMAAYNVLLVGGLTLNGLFTFLWLRRHTRHQVAALIAGLMMVAGPYAAARAYGHLNLLLFFAIPLMFILVEDIIREPQKHRWRRGVALGALAAVQLLCTEELLALAVVALLIAIVIAAAMAPHAALRRALPLSMTAAAAIAGFAIVGGVPLAYQFLGPSVPHGAIPPHDVFVNDILNFVVPTTATAVSPGGPKEDDVPKAAWTGNPIEWDAYVGIPLILVFAFTLCRWRRERWLLVVGLTTLAVAVISLGPHLHLDGVVHTRLPLPERLIDGLPIFGNIAPNRFSLLMDFGLAAVLAVFIDRALVASRRRDRVLGAVAVAMVAVSLWPNVVPASADPVPQYFQAGGDVNKIPFGTTALVFPIPYVGGAATAQPATWQAVADFRFKMVSGASISVTSTGATTFGSTAQPLRCVTDNLQVNGTDVPCSTPPSIFLAQLHSLAVHYVIVGPTANEGAIRKYFDALTGMQPVSDQGVLVWTI
jgi:hypothetical protein